LAFNGQGQWRKKQWDQFKPWVQTNVLGKLDKRMHLLRFRSAITRRRLDALLNQTLPPTFDGSVKANSFAFGDDNMPAFTELWTPQDIPGVGQRSVVPHTEGKALTGVEVQGVKDVSQREIRLLEYYEHLIQKTRLEIEKIEDEIYWCECAQTKVASHFATVDKQFSDPEFGESLIMDESVIRFSLFEPINVDYGQKLHEGEFLMKAKKSQDFPDPTPTDMKPSDFLGKLQDTANADAIKKAVN
jgi:hypothetical protein